MTNDQIMKRLLELFYGGVISEKELAIEALSAIVKSLEVIPNTEVGDALMRGYTEGRELENNRLIEAAETALKYPLYRLQAVAN